MKWVSDITPLLGHGFLSLLSIPESGHPKSVPRLKDFLDRLMLSFALFHSIAFLIYLQ